MRKIVLATSNDLEQGELKKEYLKKYIIQDTHFSTPLLEQQMNSGRFLILNIDKISFNHTKKILSCIDKFRYSIYCFTNNSEHGFLTFINKNNINFIEKISDLDKEYNFSKYRNIYHIGDVHGCYNELIKFWNRFYNENDLFIFLGDLIDRGEHSLDVIKFCLTKKDLPNVMFLEGNHDSNLWHYVQSDFSKFHSSFFYDTFKRLRTSNIEKHDIEDFMKDTKECINYRYFEKKILLSHGGLLFYPKYLFLLDSNNFIGGQGNDYTQVDKIFTNRTDWVYYQIHGHRNIYGYNSDRYIASQNLEGGVEYGGCLRVSKLNRRGFEFLYFKNHNNAKKYIR